MRVGVGGFEFTLWVSGFNPKGPKDPIIRYSVFG